MDLPARRIPVSYTHLDVYKRQAYEGEDKLNEFVAFMGVGSGEFRSLVEGSDFVWKADSFEELAELMGVDSEALAATMEAASRIVVYQGHRRRIAGTLAR